MTATASSIVRGPGEGEIVQIPDGRQFLFKVVSADTQGAYSLGEFVLPAGGTVLPHLHRENEEAFYVLEGEFAVDVGQERVMARPGCFMLIPRGTAHSLHNAGTTPARLLVVISPGGMEAMYGEIGQVLAARAASPDRSAIQSIREKYRTEDVGEPVF